MVPPLYWTAVNGRGLLTQVRTLRRQLGRCLRRRGLRPCRWWANRRCWWVAWESWWDGFRMGTGMGWCFELFWCVTERMFLDWMGWRVFFVWSFWWTLDKHLLDKHKSHVFWDLSGNKTSDLSAELDETHGWRTWMLANSGGHVGCFFCGALVRWFWYNLIYIYVYILIILDDAWIIS